jgi:hypothetical protein
MTDAPSRWTVLWFALASCGSPPADVDVGALDGGVADGGSLDGARADARVDARDAPIPPDAPPELWSVDQAFTGFCEPVAAAECEAYERCPCAIRRACDPAAIAARCREELEAATEAGRSLDGPWLARAAAARVARWESCIPPEPADGERRELPAEAIVQVAEIGQRCMASLSGGVEGCAGGYGVCRTRCGPRGGPRSACDPALDGGCLPGLRCQAGACVPPGGEGDPCTEGSSDLETCEAGLVCVADRCVRLGADGDACDDARPCAPCSRCTDGTCEAADGCDRSIEDDCGFGASCGRGLCTRPAALGESCDAVACDAGLGCDRGSLVCVDAPGPGEPCLDAPRLDDRCDEISRCDGTTCVALAAEGEPCTATCRTGLLCISSLCTAPPALGERCTGPCDEDGHCVLGFCAPLPGAGERCLEGLCARGLTCALGDVCALPDGLGCDATPEGDRQCGLALECVVRAECGWW